MMARWTMDDITATNATVSQRKSETVDTSRAAQANHQSWKDKEAAAVYPLVQMCQTIGIAAEIVPEYRFHPSRKWRFDYALPLHKIAIEIEGGVWTQGRHTRGSGYVADLEKYREAVMLGWRVLRYTPCQLKQAMCDILTLVNREAA